MKSKNTDTRHVETGNYHAQAGYHKADLEAVKDLGIPYSDMAANGLKPDILPGRFMRSAGKNKLLPFEHEHREIKLIHGIDERKPVDASQFPHQSVCLLIIEANDGRIYFGTGFFISPRCVITAGHCVFFNGNWAKTIRVVPGATGDDSAPFGDASSNRFKSVTGWTVDGNENFDYGAVLLDDDFLFSKIGVCMTCITDSTQKQIAISGYPQDKARTQWKSEGEVIRRSKFRIYYELDTVIGNSGSPIYYSNASTHTIIGVHTQGQELNFGVRVTPTMIERWNAWSKF